MSARSKRVAARKSALTREVVSRAEAHDAPYVIWDDRLTGFGVRVSPGGTKAFFVQYRTGEGRRTDRNRKLTLGRFPGLTPGAARKQAQALLGRARDGRDPSRERALERTLPRVTEAVEAWLGTRNVKDVSLQLYRRSAAVWLKGWLGRRLDQVTREDVARRFAEVTERHGRVKANLGLFVLGGTYRRSAFDHPGLRNPVERWKHAGGRAHRLERRRIEHPAVLLPAWERGIREGVRRAELRDFFRFGMYSGMRVGEVLGLRWDRVMLGEGRFVVDETKSGNPLELPVTRQVAALLVRRWEARPSESRWVFASPASPDEPVRRPRNYHRAIADHGGKPFWFHALRNCFVTVAAHELMYPESLVKRLVNHQTGGDVTQDYATKWTLEQLREPAQRIADRIDALINVELSISTSSPSSRVHVSMSARPTRADSSRTLNANPIVSTRPDHTTSHRDSPTPECPARRAGATTIDYTCPRSPTPKHRRNEVGRDFVVGDVHGCVHTLEQLLERIDFDPDRDRLFSVGDIVNRGPNSHLALEWLENGRLLGVLGNHEAMLLGALERSRRPIWTPWVRALDADEERRWFNVLRLLPLAREVETAHGPVGIVHAGVVGRDWTRTVADLESGHRPTIHTALFGGHGPDWRAPHGGPVKGVRALVTGHYPVSRPERHGAWWQIDLGAGFASHDRLGLLRIDCDPMQPATTRVVAAERQPKS